MNEADYISDIAMQEEAEEYTVEGLENQAKSDIVLGWMIQLGIPLTRKSYLGLNYPEGLPEEWTAELESMLPPCLQDFSKVKQD